MPDLRILAGNTNGIACIPQRNAFRRTAGKIAAGTAIGTARPEGIELRAAGRGEYERERLVRLKRTDLQPCRIGTRDLFLAEAFAVLPFYAYRQLTRPRIGVHPQPVALREYQRFRADSYHLEWCAVYRSGYAIHNFAYGERLRQRGDDAPDGEPDLYVDFRQHGVR